MIALDNVSCIDDFSNFLGVIKKGGNFSPIPAPGFYGQGVFATPLSSNSSSNSRPISSVAAL